MATILSRGRWVELKQSNHNVWTKYRKERKYFVRLPVFVVDKISLFSDQTAICWTQLAQDWSKRYLVAKSRPNISELWLEKEVQKGEFRPQGSSFEKTISSSKFNTEIWHVTKTYELNCSKTDENII